RSSDHLDYSLENAASTLSSLLFPCFVRSRTKPQIHVKPLERRLSTGGVPPPEGSGPPRFPRTRYCNGRVRSIGAHRRRDPPRTPRRRPLAPPWSGRRNDLPRQADLEARPGCDRPARRPPPGRRGRDLG